LSFPIIYSICHCGMINSNTAKRKRAIYCLVYEIYLINTSLISLVGAAYHDKDM